MTSPQGVHVESYIALEAQAELMLQRGSWVFNSEEEEETRQGLPKRLQSIGRSPHLG